MLKSRGGGMHHSLLSPGTKGLTFTCIKSDAPLNASPNGGVRGFQMTGAFNKL